MADSLNSKAQEQMRALCRKISVAHDLDPEIQEELYGHMEDKLHAYLSGEEPLTEEDAFILVREHFGDPAVLKGLLQDVHAHEVHVSLARRLAAAFVVSIALLIATSALHALIRTCAAAWAPSSFSSAVYFPFPELTLAPGAVVLMWIVLRRWQRQLDAGRSPWFMRWNPVSLGALITLLLLIYGLAPSVFVDPGLFNARGAPWRQALPVLLGVWCCVPVAQCLVWLWWCDRVPRRAMTTAYGFITWYILRIIPLLRRLPFAWLHLLIVDNSAGLASDASSLAHGRVPGSSLSWHLIAPRSSATLAYFYSHLSLPAWRALVLGGAALILYLLVRRVWRRNAELYPAGITGASNG